MDKVIIANDDGVKVNRSCYQFTNLFPEVKEFTSFVINKEIEENHLIAYLEGKEKTIDHEILKHCRL